VGGGGAVALQAEDAGQERSLDAERGHKQQGVHEAVADKSADLPSG